MALVEWNVATSGIAHVTLNRPDKKNAFSSAMMSDLYNVARGIRSQTNIRVVSLTGQGDLFCAGADLNWMRQQLANPPEKQKSEVKLLAKMLKAWFDIPVPIVIQVQGGAFGGGLGLMAIGDEVITEESAKFSFSEVKLGLIPATISPYVYTAIGSNSANRYFLTGQTFDAYKALSLGLIHQICSLKDLHSTHASAVKEFLKGAPSAVKKTKALFRQYGFQITDSVIETTTESLIQAWQSHEADEGINSFFARKKPYWTNNS